MNHFQENLCVDDPAITEISNQITGKVIKAQVAIGNDFAAVEQLRMKLAEAKANNHKLFSCPVCWVPVFIACRRNGDVKRFFFKHYHEDGNCPAVTRDHLPKDVIDARKYNGAKESNDHINMKDWLAISLSYDPDFSNVEKEPRWQSGDDKAKWRQPDVRALWRGQIPVVFEVQLSTTYLHVIAERRVFYQKEGGLLCWVFKAFDAEVGRLTQDDIFFNNNQNLFLVSEATVKASKEAKALTLDCRWSKPSLDNGIIVDQWDGKLAQFNELTLEQVKQRVFFYDYERTVESLKAQPDIALRTQFEQFWLSYTVNNSNASQWPAIRQKFISKNIKLATYISENKNLPYFLDTLYSAKHGKPIGWGYADLVKIAHHLYDKHPTLLWAYRSALSAFKRHAQISQEDSTQNWRNKVKSYKQSVVDGEAKYLPDRTYDDLIVFLFPEISSQLQKNPIEVFQQELNQHK